MGSDMQLELQNGLLLTLSVAIVYAGIINTAWEACRRVLYVLLLKLQNGRFKKQKEVCLQKKKK